VSFPGCTVFELFAVEVDRFSDILEPKLRRPACYSTVIARWQHYLLSHRSSKLSCYYIVEDEASLHTSLPTIAVDLRRHCDLWLLLLYIFIMFPVGYMTLSVSAIE